MLGAVIERRIAADQPRLGIVVDRKALAGAALEAVDALDPVAVMADHEVVGIDGSWRAGALRRRGLALEPAREVLVHDLGVGRAVVGGDASAPVADRALERARVVGADGV